MKSLLALLLVTALPAFAQSARCPTAAEQLSEYLASAKQRVGAEGEVRVEFEVGADGRAQPLSVQGERRYRTPVRIAMHSLECQAGTPQRYALTIRFVEPVSRKVAATASVTLAEAGAERHLAARQALPAHCPTGS
ncbi:MAG: hypothetical protein ACK4R2_09490 [Roseateles sp.]